MSELLKKKKKKGTICTIVLTPILKVSQSEKNLNSPSSSLWFALHI